MKLRGALAMAYGYRNSVEALAMLGEISNDAERGFRDARRSEGGAK